MAADAAAVVAESTPPEPWSGTHARSAGARACLTERARQFQFEPALTTRDSRIYGAGALWLHGLATVAALGPLHPGAQRAGWLWLTGANRSIAVM